MFRGMGFDFIFFLIEACMMTEVLNRPVLNTVGLTSVHHLNNQKANSKTCYFQMFRQNLLKT